MFESLVILHLLLVVGGFALAVYGALLFRKHFGIVGPLWGLAIVVADRLSNLVGSILRDSSNPNYEEIGSKVESFWEMGFSALIIYIRAFQAFFEIISYFLLILIILSDLTKLLAQKEIRKPKFLPAWSNRTTHIIGAIAVLCYLLNHWLLAIAYQMAGAI